MNEESSSASFSKVPSSLTTVTPFSKGLALVLFVAMPFVGFYLGMRYASSSVLLIDDESIIALPEEASLTYYSPPDGQNYSYCPGDVEKTYSTDGKNVYFNFFEPQVLVGANPVTFNIVSVAHYPCGTPVVAVAKDDKRVYVLDQAIDADAPTFKLLGTGGNGVYQDIRGVYQDFCNGDWIGGNLRKCEDIDIGSFVHIANAYYRDKSNVYNFASSPKVMRGLRGHVRGIDDRYVRDDVRVYYYDGSIIDGADPNTFHTIRDPKIRNELFAADSTYVYWGNRRVPELDPLELVIMSNNYVKDGDTVYYVSYIEPDNVGVIKGADVDSFEIVDERWEVARDKYRKYEHGVPIQ